MGQAGFSAQKSRKLQESVLVRAYYCNYQHQTNTNCAQTTLQVILPTDFVVGDIEVDEHGPLPGQALPGDDGENENELGGANRETDATASENRRSSGQGVASAGAELPGAGDGGGGGGGGGSEVLDIEPEDPAMGFEYDGEVIGKTLILQMQPLTKTTFFRIQRVTQRFSQIQRLVKRFVPKRFEWKKMMASPPAATW